MARARRRPAVGRGPDGDRPLLPQRPQAARGQRDALTMSPTGKSGMAVVPFKTSGAPGGHGAATHLATPAARSSRRARAGGSSRSARARAPAARSCACSSSAWRPTATSSGSAGSTTRAPRGPCSRSARSAAWRARPSPRTTCSGGCWPAGHFKVRHPDHGKHVEADLSRQVMALIQGCTWSASTRRARASPRRRRSGELPGLLEDARDQRQGDVLLQLLHPRLRDPRLLRGAGLRRQPRLPAHAHPRRGLGLPLDRVGDIVDVYP